MRRSPGACAPPRGSPPRAPGRRARPRAAWPAAAARRTGRRRCAPAGRSRAGGCRAPRRRDQHAVARARAVLLVDRPESRSGRARSARRPSRSGARWATWRSSSSSKRRRLIRPVRASRSTRSRSSRLDPLALGGVDAGRHDVHDRAVRPSAVSVQQTGCSSPSPRLSVQLHLDRRSAVRGARERLARGEVLAVGDGVEPRVRRRSVLAVERDHGHQRAPPRRSHGVERACGGGRDDAREIRHCTSTFGRRRADL